MSVYFKCNPVLGRNDFVYYMYLALFGVLGATLRYAVSLWIDTDFPLDTLLINMIGCFLLAFLTSFLSEIPALSKKFVSAVGTGFVGSFTTFSTFAMEVSELLLLRDYILAATYMLASLIFGLAACILGYRTSRILSVWRERHKNGL